MLDPEAEGRVVGILDFILSDGINCIDFKQISDMI